MVHLETVPLVFILHQKCAETYIQGIRNRKMLLFCFIDYFIIIIIATVINARVPIKYAVMEQKGMTFDHDFSYYILLFSSLLKKEGREKENEVAKIVIKSHAFLFHHMPFAIRLQMDKNKKIP